MEKLTVEVPPESIYVKNATCPAGHSLMDEQTLMDGLATIKLHVSAGGCQGDAHLHPCYGNHQVHTHIEVSDGEVYDISCPVCRQSLLHEEERCMFCAAPMFSMHMPNGGLVQACSRRGCHNHKLKVVDLSAQLAELFELDMRPRF